MQKIKHIFKLTILITGSLVIVLGALFSYFVKTNTDKALADLNFDNKVIKIEQKEVTFTPTSLDFINYKAPLGLYVIFGEIDKEKYSLSLTRFDSSKLNFEHGIPRKLLVYHTSSNPKNLFIRPPGEILNEVGSLAYHDYFLMYIQFLGSLLF